MGFSKNHLRCYVMHYDKAGQHIHIIASRIDLLHGQLYLGRNENLISTRIIQGLEKEDLLPQTVGPSPTSPPRSTGSSLLMKILWKQGQVKNHQRKCS